MIGPFFFDEIADLQVPAQRQNRNQANSLKFIQMMLEKVFPKYLELFPNDWMNCYFHVDGSSIHTAAESTQFLDENFPHRWIGNNGPMLWPPRYKLVINNNWYMLFLTDPVI